MPQQLVALSEGPNILLDKPILLIGRHQECDIQIASRKISRRHCCIAQVNDHLVVRDLCSTNGICINGVRVTEGPLKIGDELTIGSLRYQVNQNDAKLPPPSPAQPAPARPVPPLANDPFASLDQPVPLNEPMGPLSEVGLAPKAAAGPASPGEKKQSLILPQNIEMLNSSGDFQMPSPPKH